MGDVGVVSGTDLVPLSTGTIDVTRGSLVPKIQTCAPAGTFVFCTIPPQLSRRVCQTVYLDLCLGMSRQVRQAFPLLRLLKRQRMALSLYLSVIFTLPLLLFVSLRQ